MLRFVVGPHGEIAFDVAARLPGRGIWLTASRPIIERAVSRRAFNRAARREIAMPPDLANHVEARLSARCCETIGLARRAGIAVAGFEKVSAALKRQATGGLVVARDAGDWARRKFAASVPTIDCLSSVELGAVFGREKIVHVWVGPGQLSARLIVDAARLAGVRTDDVAPVALRRDAV
jgi:predicted RNA-binding protein YlxR (DUF448 family)